MYYYSLLMNLLFMIFSVTKKRQLTKLEDLFTKYITKTFYKVLKLSCIYFMVAILHTKNVFHLFTSSKQLYCPGLRLLNSQKKKM